MAGTTVPHRETAKEDSDLYALRRSFNIMVDEADVRDTATTELIADDNSLANQIAARTLPEGVLGGDFTFATAGAVTIAVTGGARYRINGIEYYKRTLAATLTLEDPGDVTQDNFIAWRVEIDALGAITTKACALAGGYSTAQKALLALSAVARTANTAVLGYITATDSNSVINIGTDNTNASGATYVFYYQLGPKLTSTGLNAAMSVAPTLTAASTTFNTGTINVNVNGLKVAQIAAITAQALTDADTVTTLKFGCLLGMTDLAGTGVVTLNQAGLPGVQTMASNTLAAAKALIDTLVDRLPSMFCPIFRIDISNGSASTFTCKTTNWDATSITSAITAAGVAGFDRTVTSGFNANQIVPATIPAAVSATTPTQTAYKVADHDGVTT